MAESHIPIACSLPMVESRNQINEWHDLSEMAVSTERIDGGFAITFESDAESKVVDLATRESACCGFLAITTSRTSDGVRLEMSSTDPAALPVIELLIGPDQR